MNESTTFILILALSVTKMKMQYLKCTIAIFILTFCFYPPSIRTFTHTHTHTNTTGQKNLFPCLFDQFLFSWNEGNEGKLHWTIHHKQMCIFCIFLHLFGWFWCWFHLKHLLILLTSWLIETGPPHSYNNNASVGMSDSVVKVKSGSESYWILWCGLNIRFSLSELIQIHLFSTWMHLRSFEWSVLSLCLFQ